MRIILIRSTYSEFGGAEVFTLSIIKELSRLQCELTLLTRPGQAWPLAQTQVRVVELGGSAPVRVLRLGSFNREVLDYLSKHQADIVFAVDRVATATHYHAGGGSHREFLQARDEEDGFFKRTLRRWSPFHRAVLALEKQLMHNPALKKVHCCSNMVRRDMQNHYKLADEKLVVIPNGVDHGGMEAQFNDRKKLAQELRERHQLHRDATYLLFIGSGFQRKGLDVCIHGLATLPMRYQLIVVGKGNISSYQRMAQELDLAGRVHFLGPQPSAFKYCVLASALLLPSRYDPFGLAPAEAQAMGLPVLVSDKTGYADILDKTGHGVVHQLGGTEAGIADSFQRLADLIGRADHAPERIRQSVADLDHKIIMGKMCGEFFEIKIN